MPAGVGVRAGSPRNPTSKTRPSRRRGCRRTRRARTTCGRRRRRPRTRDVDDAVGAGVPDRVGDQVGQRPVQLAAVAGDRGRAVAAPGEPDALCGRPAGRSAARQSDTRSSRATCSVVDARRCRTGCARARTGRRPSSPAGRRERASACSRARAIVGDTVLERLGHRPQAGERRAQVVAHPGHQLAPRGFERLFAFAGARPADGRCRRARGAPRSSSARQPRAVVGSGTRPSPNSATASRSARLSPASRRPAADRDSRGDHAGHERDQ